MTAERDPTADRRTSPRNTVIADIRDELLSHFAWPASQLPISRPLLDLGSVVDLARLADVAASVHNGKELAFTIISREYIQTGLNWIHAMNSIGFHAIMVLAGDKVSADLLDARGVPNVLMEIDESRFDSSFVSTTGFSAKGLAVSAFKFPVARFLVAAGYSVALSDADAIWLRDPMPSLRPADVAFQRIAYHPRPISRFWGFAACGGFNAFRANPKAVAFLDECILQNQIIFCDQIALNLALLVAEPEWRCAHPEWQPPATGAPHDQAAHEAAFAKYAGFPIISTLQPGGLRVMALPHDQFWRHEVVPIAMSDVLVCHPNSPKDDLEKMKILTAMGLRFDPAAPPVACRPSGGLA